MHSKGGYREPIVVIALILDHRDGHYVRLNKVAMKYPNFKNDVDQDVHVRMFNFIIKTNAKTFEEYIINLFNYMLRVTTLD
jgi:plasmid replication initiation protein